MRSAAFVAVGSLLVVAVGAHAAPGRSDRRAAELIRSGKAALEAERYETARRLFVRSFERHGEVSGLFYAAESHRLEGSFEEALSGYETFLEEAPAGHPLQRDAERYVTGLRQVLFAKSLPEGREDVVESDGEAASLDVPETAEVSRVRAEQAADRRRFWLFLGMTGAVGVGTLVTVRSVDLVEEDRDVRFADIEIVDEREGTYVIGELADHAEDVLVTGEGGGSTRRDPGCAGMYGTPECQVAAIGDSCAAAERYREAQSGEVSLEVEEFLDSCESVDRARLVSRVLLGATILSAVVTGYYGYQAFRDRQPARAGPVVGIDPRGGAFAGVRVSF